MAEVIRMPKMSDTMEEGVIASWLVKVGDKVQSGDILAEVETDKATMELENYEDGIILHLAVDEKSSVPIDGILAIVGEKGEDYQSLLTESTPAESEVSDAAPAVDTSSINAEIINMPHMSDTMSEGTIASWLVKVGDQVQSGDILAEVETDKATMELENYVDGIVLYLAVEAGDSVPVDQTIAIIGEENTDYQALLAAQKVADAPSTASTPEPMPITPASTGIASRSSSTMSSQSDDGRIKASPLAKKIAKDKGYNISDIQGTGEDGRIVKRDVENFTLSTKPAPSAAGDGEESFEDISLSQMRKTVARRLGESKFSAPHFYLTMEIDMDKVMTARKSMNDISPVKISFNDIIIKAAAAALRQHSNVNAAWLNDKIRINHHVHMGVAVAVDEGLLVPVIKFADTKTISQISAEIKLLGSRARDKKLQPAEMEGGTFAVSNLGMFGIEEFTAIINPPNACIMAVGAISQVPVIRDGEIKIGNVMKVTLSCDHRIVDGAVGSAYLQTFKSLLEDPIKLLI